MRPHLLLALALPLASACDPCAGFGGTVVTDPLDLAEPGAVEEMQALVDEWLGWVGPDRVCVAEVSFAEEADDWSRLLMGATWEIAVDPDAAPAPAVRSSLCLALDTEERLSARLPEPGDDPEATFLNGCFQGAPAPGWPEHVERACGTDFYSDRERFLLDEVYVNAPDGRVDGDLVVTADAPVRVPGVPYASAVVAAGDRVAVLQSVNGEGEEELLVHLVDLDSGDVTTPVEVGGTSLWGSLFGGDRAVVVVRDGESEVAHVIAPDGDVDTVALDEDVVYRAGVVNGGTLYTYPELQVGLNAVDLATGEARAIALPTTEAPRTVTVSDLVAVEGGLVAELLDAEVVVRGDAVTIGVHGYTFARWDAETEEWTELADDFHGSLAGALDDDLVFATLYADAGHVLAAYDFAADELLVSDDLCADTTQPSLVVEGRALTYAGDGEDLLLTPHTVARGP